MHRFGGSAEFCLTLSGVRRIEKRSDALVELGKGRQRGSEGETAMADKSSNSAQTAESDKGYWRANLRLIYISLVIWALVSFGLGILLRPMLSGIATGGTDLGLWFAQQGSILVFLVLIFNYAWRMNRLDAEFGVEEE